MCQKAKKSKILLLKHISRQWKITMNMFLDTFGNNIESLVEAKRVK